jgi:K+-transporting ATPase ATPase A chain
VLWPDAAASLNNRGPHGFSEILYAYASATANNGSASQG